MILQAEFRVNVEKKKLKIIPDKKTGLSPAPVLMFKTELS